MQAYILNNQTNVISIKGRLKENVLKQYDPNKPFSKETINEFSQILSTFKFIDPKPEPVNIYIQLPKILLSILYTLILSLIFMQTKWSPGIKILLVFPITILFLFLLFIFSLASWPGS